MDSPIRLLYDVCVKPAVTLVLSAGDMVGVVLHMIFGKHVKENLREFERNREFDTCYLHADLFNKSGLFTGGLYFLTKAFNTRMKHTGAIACVNGHCGNFERLIVSPSMI